ncbi:hypothetical protein [Streptomyces sp. NPDC046862]
MEALRGRRHGLGLDDGYEVLELAESEVSHFKDPKQVVEILVIVA